MTNPDMPRSNDDLQIGDFFTPLLNYWHLIWHATIASTALAVLAGGVYFFTQPIRWSASLDFRPVFTGAAAKQYPNGLPFSSSDIIDQTVLDQVYDNNQLQDACGRPQFRSGFVVEESSPELQLLDLDYQARLADTRLSTVDRERLQNEYRSRRQTAPVGYRLTWLRADSCRGVPQAVAFKSLDEVLQTWASDADTKRGVLKIRVAVLTPSVFETINFPGQTLLVRADVIRSALNRVIANVREVETLPGSELVKGGADHVSFAHVRARLEDLVQVNLDPLVAEAGLGLGSESGRWVEQQLAGALTEQKAAEERADAYQAALREYSGLVPAPPAVGALRPPNSSDVQALTPQIDRTFIDRIIEMSSTNTTFRQEMTRSLVRARVSAIETAARVEHYKQLLAAMKSRGDRATNMPEMERKLTALIGEAAAQVKQFDSLYDEFSRVSLRSGPSMYQTEGPAAVQALRAFTLRSFALLVLAVLFATPMALALGCLVHHALHQIVKRPMRA